MNVNIEEIRNLYTWLCMLILSGCPCEEKNILPLSFLFVSLVVILLIFCLFVRLLVSLFACLLVN